jgi:small subunit ribosomal protein S2
VVTNLVAHGGHVLFIGTKRQAMDIIKEEAGRCGMHSVTNRWLGGTLTNFSTIKTSIERMNAIEAMRGDGTFERLVKKEVLKLEKERNKLEKFVGGIRNMSSLPAAVLVVDPNKEMIAVSETIKLGITLIALIDTNCDPDPIDIPIPGNDDAIRSIKLVTSRIADSCLNGVKKRRETAKFSGADAASSGPVGPQVEVTRRSRSGGSKPPKANGYSKKTEKSIS